MNVSRRYFLQLMGATMLPLPTADFFPETRSTDFRIRILEHSAVYLWPTTSSPTVGDVYADSIHKVLDIDGDWLKIAAGYVLITSAQLMLQANATRQINAVTEPTWVEVVTPYLAMRQYASIDAPLEHRANHADVLSVNHSFYDDHQRWWGKCSRGWFQMAHIQRAPIETSVFEPARDLSLYFDIEEQAINIQMQSQTIAQLAAIIPRNMPKGLKIVALSPSSDTGKPWHISLSRKWQIHGEGSHNCFGKHARPATSRSVTLSTLTARWLYSAVKANPNIALHVQK